MGGITCMHTMTCMLLNSLACDQKHFLACLLYASCWDGSLTCMAQLHLWVHVVPIVVPILVGTHSLVYVAIVLPWVVSWTHATCSLFHSLPSRDLHVVPSPHSLSLQIFFHHKWICLSLQLFSAFCVVNNLPLTFIVSSMLPSIDVHDATHCDAIAVIYWCACIRTTWCLHG